MKIDVLDYGYVEFIEAWGTGNAGVQCEADPMSDHPADYECGIIEAARQSTQGSFRGWEAAPCDCDQAFPNDSWGDNGEHSAQCASKLNPGDRRLLSFLHNNKHATPFEFAGMVLEIQAPIFVFREWHRHRTQSYNEASARYAPLPNLNYIPSIERLMLDGGVNKQAGALKGAELTSSNADRFQYFLMHQYQQAEDLYQAALTEGVPKELARLVLPVGRYSKMRASTNLRNWLQFLTLRLDPAAQYEIRQYAKAIEEIMHEHFPQTMRLVGHS